MRPHRCPGCLRGVASPATPLTPLCSLCVDERVLRAARELALLQGDLSVGRTRRLQ